LALAAWLSARDLTRPGNIARDRARAQYLQAVAVDPKMARVWRELAIIDSGRERPREATEHALRATRAAPGWWPAELALMEAYRARGMEQDADAALDRALAAVPASAGAATGGCAIFDVAFRRAQQRNQVVEEQRLVDQLAACDAQSDIRVDKSRQRGDLEGVEAALERLIALAADPAWLRAELASVRLARRKADAAARDLENLVLLAPRDGAVRTRLADAYLASGDAARARQVIARALREFPTRGDIRQAARAVGVPLPLDEYRMDGRQVVRSFAASGRRYAAPAVLVLDRTVVRVGPDGSQLVLTHNVVRVESKDGIERWGEIAIPEGAEVLTLRTHKPDGTVREPEEIIGKDAISAPDLTPGDYVEWETLESREPSDSHAPGFLGDRFYFQSLEAPLDHSEYLLITPPGIPLDVDARAQAPQGLSETARDGSRVTRFLAKEMPQIFAERAAVPPIEWIPSVRVSSGATLGRWSRFVADQMQTIARSSPALRQHAATLAASCKHDRRCYPDAIVRWVTEHIEAESDLLEPASATLARRRGNRVALIVALGRVLGLDPQIVLARPLLVAAADAPLVAQELDDFSDVLVRFAGAGAEPPRFVDARWRRAPFGYLPPALDGAAVFAVGSERLDRARNAVADSRKVVLSLAVAADGQGEASVTETLVGWPSIEWSEVLDSAGKDRSKLRQDFEQRWLSQHFPGAVLKDLQLEPIDAGRQGTTLRYSFTSPQIASRQDDELKLAPSFFRSSPGRRYATEQRRRTTLLVGFDVPLDLEADIRLPPGARVLDVGERGRVTAGTKGEVKFVEERAIEQDAVGSARVGSHRVKLRRQARLPILRVGPREYSDLASKLRQVDPLEQSEIRVQLAPDAAAAGKTADAPTGPAPATGAPE
jgi:tetratricopeptide (TPR) repeat protein